LKPRSLVK